MKCCFIPNKIMEKQSVTSSIWFIFNSHCCHLQVLFVNKQLPAMSSLHRIYMSSRSNINRRIFWAPLGWATAWSHPSVLGGCCCTPTLATCLLFNLSVVRRRGILSFKENDKGTHAVTSSQCSALARPLACLTKPQGVQCEASQVNCVHMPLTHTQLPMTLTGGVKEKPCLV